MCACTFLDNAAFCIGDIAGWFVFDLAKCITVGVRLASQSLEIKLSGTLRAFVIVILGTICPGSGNSIGAGTSLVIATDGICDARSRHKFNPAKGIAVGPMSATRSL